MWCCIYTVYVNGLSISPSKYATNNRILYIPNHQKTILHSLRSDDIISVAPNNNYTNHQKEDIKQQLQETETTGNVTILSRSPYHIVVEKPPSVLCHHSGWAGSRAKQKRGEVPEVPMLQRVRDAVNDIVNQEKAFNENINHDDIVTDTQEGIMMRKQRQRKVNLIHRLDRGASGALLFAFADEEDDSTDNNIDTNKIEAAIDQDETTSVKKRNKTKGATATLIEAMTSSSSIKTYVALVRGEGILKGEDLKAKGWFEVNRPIKDEAGEVKDASTMFRFVSGQAEHELPDGTIMPRVSCVLARPKTGRWHQIRRHLNGLSHPILGDTTHGSSKVNKEWKKRNMAGERTCLHLGRIQLPPTNFTPDGIDIASPLPDDMLNMMKVYAPKVLSDAVPVLESEGIEVDRCGKEYETGQYIVPLPSESQKRKRAADEERIEILEQSNDYVIVSKPPRTVCHHSSWTGKRSERRRWKEPTPMLQRVRDLTGKRVNLVHRLDRSASGCLVFAFASNHVDNDNEDTKASSCSTTKSLISAMQNKDATKTYFALCNGDGTLRGENLKERGWFTVDQPIIDEHGRKIQNATTDILVVGSANLSPTEGDNGEGRKVSIILARPKTGRYHQVRQHLASSSVCHSIIGDSSHGYSRTNRIWKKNRNLQKERTCLHLARVQIPPMPYAPNGIDVSCDLSEDLLQILEEIPELLDNARRTLQTMDIKL